MRKIAILAIAAVIFADAAAWAASNPWTYNPANVALTTDTRLFVLTPQMFGGNPDTQETSTATSSIAGSKAIHTAYAGWNSSMLNNYIVIEDAGAPLTTGGIASDGVASHGTGYLDVPVPVVTSTNGGHAHLRAYLSANSVSIVAGQGGYGCTNGTATLTLAWGLETSPLTVSATVSGGTVTAIGSIITAGAYSESPSPGKNLLQFTGDGCTTNPIFNVNFGVTAIAVKGSGAGYPVSGAGVSVTLSGGSPTTPATLTTPTITATPQPLAARIQSITDANDIVLSASASATMTAATKTIRFGATDNYTAISNMFNAVAYGGTVCFPGSWYQYGVAEQVTLPDWKPVQISCATSQSSSVGTAPSGATIAALAPMSSVLYRDSWGSSGVDLAGGTKIEGITLDGSSLASTVCFFGHVNELTGRDFTCDNAATGGADIQVGTASTYAAVKFDNVHARNDNGLWYSTASALPDYGLLDYSYDSIFDNIEASDVLISGIDAESWSNSIYHTPHVWGYPAPYYYSDYGMRILSGDVSINTPYMDGFAVSGIYANGAYFSITDGHADFPPDNTTGEETWNYGVSAGIELGDGLAAYGYSVHGYKIEGNASGNLPPAEGIIKDGTNAAANAYVFDNPGSSYYNFPYSGFRFGAGCPGTSITGSMWCFNSDAANANNSSGTNSFGIGSALDDRGDNGVKVFANGGFAGKLASAQRRDVQLYGTMTGSAIPLTSSGGSASASNQLQMPAAYDASATMTGLCDFIMPSTSSAAHTVASYEFVLSGLKWLRTAGGTVSYLGGTITTGQVSGSWASNPVLSGGVDTLGATGGPALLATGPTGSEASCSVSVNELY